MRHRNFARLFTQVASLLHFCSWLSPTAGHEPRPVLLPDSDQFSASPGLCRQHPCNIVPSQAATSSVVTSWRAQDKNGWHQPGLSSGRGNSAEMRHRNFARLFTQVMLPYVTFAYNTAIQETTQMTPFELAYGKRPTTMLDAMLPHVEDDDLNADVQGCLQRAEEARQLARARITDQQLVDAGRYNLRQRAAKCHPEDRVWV
ncbi:uncharacterized protein LOC144161673 [Haemaphysalis longicornis]